MHGFRRQLAGFAHRDEPLAQARGQRGAEQEPAGLQARHGVELIDGNRQRGLQGVHQDAQALGVGKHGHEVAEDDAFLGEAGDGTNQGHHMVRVLLSHQCQSVDANIRLRGHAMSLPFLICPNCRVRCYFDSVSAVSMTSTSSTSAAGSEAVSMASSIGT